LLPFMEKEKSAGAKAAGKVVMATVKGDVHDIGKNIVGVVLGCNNYKVVDLGVMVPCDRILDTAIAEKADIIGLSGLITPSLDEMVFVAKEMERRKIALPLLIGGATTSRQHTAVKIAPAFNGATVHVLDASRAVNVVASLLDQRQKGDFVANEQKEQARLREVHAGKQQRPLVSYLDALSGRTKIEFREQDVAQPEFIGPRVLEDFPLREIAKYIDWTFFFVAWELKGKFPKILESPEYGAAARELYDHGRKLLDRIIEQRLLRANAVYGFWPASTVGDDIVLFSDESRRSELLRFNMLRQQQQFGQGQPFRSLSDFVAPQASGLRDHVGAFALTAGLGSDELVKEFEADLDDYDAIMVKALADRLAEAFAELLHQRARREWGYGKSETLTNDELIDEKYRGIRPAFGYPACPDHTEKGKLFELLGAQSIGMELTESYAMLPAASVSGLYFAHPEARYFNVGRIGKDQALDYAKRKGSSVDEIERWLRPNLGY
ncbi:MAG TPA: vitamin B12 dependent-methionine synthase activation domain-containing protein, partial [Polyangiaceae bacterium]|nr:vitamin B12 dependent-methionine synthase activation domain-containing protein [Polyangiaceae bacterium]